MPTETDWLGEARRIARKVRRRYPHIGFDDAIGAAHVAVALLLNDFNSTRGTSALVHVRSLGLKRAVDELRDAGLMIKKHQPERPEQLPTADLDKVSHADPAEAARFRELAEHSCLFPDERRVLRLYYGEGLTFKVIGERLGMAETTVWTRHNEAIAKLREALRHESQ